jgi:hypothetical protein
MKGINVAKLYKLREMDEVKIELLEKIKYERA